MYDFNSDNDSSEYMVVTYSTKSVFTLTPNWSHPRLSRHHSKDLVNNHPLKSSHLVDYLHLYLQHLMYVHIFYTMVELDLNNHNKKINDGYNYGVCVNFVAKINDVFKYASVVSCSTNIHFKYLVVPHLCSEQRNLLLRAFQSSIVL